MFTMQLSTIECRSTIVAAILTQSLLLTGACDCALRVSAGETPASREATVPAVDEVLAAWQLREQRLQTLQATWIHERTYTKLWGHCHVPFARDEYVTLQFKESRLVLDGDCLRFDSPGVDSSGDVLWLDETPPSDQVGRTEDDPNRRVLQDKRNRYDAGRPRVDPRDPRFEQWPRNVRAFTTIYDGARSLQFLPAERGLYPEAYLFSGSENRFQTSLHYLPLILAARPGSLKLLVSHCRIDNEAVEFRDRNCHVLVDTSGLRREFWVDPEQDYSVVSYREECDVLGSRMKNRIDIHYREDADGNWLPAAWTTLFFDNNGLLEQHASATVLAATTAAPADAATFRVDLPAGTWVFDEAASTHHLVAADGNARAITAVQLRQGLSYAELMRDGRWSAAMQTAMQAWQSTVVRFSVFLIMFASVSIWIEKQCVRFKMRESHRINV